MQQSWWPGVFGIGLLTVLGLPQARAAACEQTPDTSDYSNSSARGTLTLPLDVTLQAPSSFSEQFTRDLSLYMLRGLLPWDAADALVIETTKIVIDCSALSAEHAAALDAARDQGGSLEPRRLRELFDRVHRDTRSLRGHDDWIPADKTDLIQRLDYHSWPRTVVTRSAVKRKTRVIYRSPIGFALKLSVSETLASESGDLSASILETEVAVMRRDGSSDWDFYAYDEAGLLADYSTFPAGRRAAPQVCLNCHYDAGAKTMSRFLPE